MQACCGGLSGAPQRTGRKGYKALTVTQEVLAFSVPPQDRELQPEEIEGKEFGEEPQVCGGWVWGGMGWEMGRGPQQCPGGTMRKKKATGTRARTEDETERGGADGPRAHGDGAHRDVTASQYVPQTCPTPRSPEVTAMASSAGRPAEQRGLHRLASRARAQDSVISVRVLLQEVFPPLGGGRDMGH